MSANWTNEMRCPQIVQVTCDGTHFPSDHLIWEAKDTEIGEYKYDVNDSYPFTVTSLAGYNISIDYAKMDSDDNLTINSTLITESNLILHAKISYGYSTKKKYTSISGDFNCVDVHLNVNDTLEDDTCPAGLELKSRAQNVENIYGTLNKC